MKKPAYIIAENHITIFVNGQPKIVQNEGSSYSKVINAIKEQDWDLVVELADKLSAIKNYIKDGLELRGRTITYNGENLYGYLIDKIIQFMEANLEVDTLLAFLAKLMQNPSRSCINDLYAFLEHGNMPIDPDGDFYAYKAVRNDWTDKHTGTLKNNIGQIVEVPRNRVDDNPLNGCSHGLHAGSIKYVQSFGSGDDKYIIVKINPADVVSVPSHDTSKLRCSKYMVVQEYTDILPDTTYDYENPTVWNEPDDDEIDDDVCPECGDEWEYCDC